MAVIAPWCTTIDIALPLKENINFLNICFKFINYVGPVGLFGHGEDTGEPQGRGEEEAGGEPEPQVGVGEGTPRDGWEDCDEERGGEDGQLVWEPWEYQGETGVYS